MTPSWLRCGGPDPKRLAYCAAERNDGTCCQRKAAVLDEGTEAERPDRWCDLHRKLDTQQAAAQGGAEIRSFP